MPSPSGSLASLRPELGSLMEFDLAADRQGFIAYSIAPVLKVGVPSGTYGVIKLEELLKKRNHLARAMGAGYNRDTFQFDDDSFATMELGAEQPVDDRAARIYADYFDAEAMAAALARDAVLRKAEIRVADLIFNTTTWTGSDLTTAVTNEWDDATNATPVTDVRAAAKKVWNKTGIWPNALIINRFVLGNLRVCDQIKDAIASTGAGESTLQRRITAAQIAEALDLDFVLVSGSAKNAADEGIARSLSPIFSDEYAMVARVAVTDNIAEPCVARTFHYTADGSEIGGMIESYRDEAIRSDVIRVRHDVQEKVMGASGAVGKYFGHLLSNITT